MNLLLAVSADGFLCTGPDDDMKWTGSLDKFAFKLLTLSSDQPLLAGRVTFDQMPNLPGRTMYCLSNRPETGMSLDVAHFYYPRAWVIGGPTIAEEALKKGFIDRAYLCQVPSDLNFGISVDPIRALLPVAPLAVAKYGDYTVQVFEIGVV